MRDCDCPHPIYSDEEASAVAVLTVNGCCDVTIPVDLCQNCGGRMCLVSLPVCEIEQRARRYDGSFELHFILTLSTPMPEKRNLYAVLRFPWDMDHYLGPVTTDTSSVTSARMLKGIPAQAKVIVRTDRCLPRDVASPWPAEMLLKEHVKVILENDEFCGSVASSHVQNLVRDLPFYESGMRRFKKWSDFAAYFGEHYRSWTAVTYSVDEHRLLGLSELTPREEQRLVANRFLHRYTHGDVLRDQVKLCALREYRRLLLEESADGTLDDSQDMLSAPLGGVDLSREKLRSLSTSRSFLTLNCVNYLQVMKQASACFSILFCPLHPLRMDVDSPDRLSSQVFRFGHRKYTALALR